jgi:hypothetical protein
MTNLCSLVRFAIVSTKSGKIKSGKKIKILAELA